MNTKDLISAATISVEMSPNSTIKLIYFIKFYHYCLLQRHVKLINRLADIHYHRQLKSHVFNMMRQRVVKRREIARLCRKLTATPSRPLTLIEFAATSSLLPVDALKRIYAIYYHQSKLTRKYFKIYRVNSQREIV